MEGQLLSTSEENYLKSIYELSNRSEDSDTSTNELASYVGSKPATVTETLKRLADKGLLRYEKYQPVRLTIIGKNMALRILRKQRIWNTYLFEKLGLELNELTMHSDQLEHVHSEKLINILDEMLGKPLFDPFGDPIPDAKGQVRGKCFKSLDQIKSGEICRITGFKNRSELFIQYIRKIGLHIGNHLLILDKEAFDGTLTVLKNGQSQLQLPASLAQNIITSTSFQCCAFEKQLTEPPCLTQLIQLVNKYPS
ncbi:MAG: metal-dependent transcriptional regulator [Saprospiraceae bacterium]|nr:metal-dependent transcriptional regulator [Saprospiraceae bacterium]